jgi:hypothetical protein
MNKRDIYLYDHKKIIEKMLEEDGVRGISAAAVYRLGCDGKTYLLVGNTKNVRRRKFSIDEFRN